MSARPRSIYIVGMMGAGKSAVGRLLATRLDRTFVDVDQEIQQRTGVPITTIFEFEGESGFRRREEELIDELTQQAGIVLATGGGAVMSAITRARLVQRGFTIYLRATAHDLWLRTRNDRNRPLLDCADPRERLEQLLLAREPHYQEVADLVIETGKPSVTRLVAMLVAQLTEHEATHAASLSIGRAS